MLHTDTELGALTEAGKIGRGWDQEGKIIKGQEEKQHTYLKVPTVNDSPGFKAVQAPAYH